MQENKYVRPHAARAASWASKLATLQETMDNLCKLQASWLYLEPIFNLSDEALNKMTKEIGMFRAVDSIWHEAILALQQKSTVLEVFESPGIRASLVEANSNLDVIRKGLKGYLDEKRSIFPRFNFVSDIELLKLLADAANPISVQPHLHKCFDGVACLVFSTNLNSELEVVAALDSSPSSMSNSGTYERIDFENSNPGKTIRPSMTTCDVERWLGEVETASKQSLAFYIVSSLKNRGLVNQNATSRLSKAMTWQEQVLIIVCQVSWTRDIEKALRRAAALTAEVEEATVLEARRVSVINDTRHPPEQFQDPLAALRSVLAIKQSLLEETTSAVGTSADQTRFKLKMSALIVMDIHHRDIICALIDAHVCDSSDFEWTVHLRYYFHGDRPGGLGTRCLHSTLQYAYEYLGGGARNRLVLTPLTLRCFRAIFCSLEAYVGCTLFSVSAAGSSSTLGALSQAVASRLVTFDCTSRVMCTSIGQLLRGAASGAWMCLHKFSRLGSDVLSVAVTQINDAFAVIRKQNSRDCLVTKQQIESEMKLFIIEGGNHADDVAMSHQWELFRPFSLGCPNQNIITEVLLISHGIKCVEAHKRAKQVSTTLKLCAELLTQGHLKCSFDLRLACVAIRRFVLTAQLTDGWQGDEHVESTTKQVDTLLARVLFDLIEPSITQEDKHVLRLILETIFPNVALTFDREDSSEDLAMSFREACPKLKQQMLDNFLTFVIKLDTALTSWPGVSLTGPTFTGKTSIWQNLEASLKISYEKRKCRWTRITSHTIQINALTLAEIYGSYNVTENAWVDGICAHLFREKTSGTEFSGPLQGRLFLVLDGNVNSLWAEHLHTALDEPALLCLGNGEMLRRSSSMSIIFESENLNTAAPATVSRMGIIDCSNSYMRWQVLFESWISAQRTQEATSSIPREHSSGDMPSKLGQVEPLEHEFLLNEEEISLLEALFDWLLEPSLAFIGIESLYIITLMTDESLVQSLLRLLDGMLRLSLHGTAVGSADVKERRQRRQHIECAFVWALLWSVGSPGDDTAQARFGVFIREIIADVQIISTQYPSVQKTLQQRNWSLPEFTGVFSGTLQLTLPIKGLAHDYEYRPGDSETGTWRVWQPTLQTGQGHVPEFGSDTVLSEVLVPTAQTVQSNLLIDLLIQGGGHPALFCGPPGCGKTVHARAALASLPKKRHRTAYVRFHATTSAPSVCQALLVCLARRRKDVYGPPINQHAVVLIDDLNLPDADALAEAQMPLEMLRGLMEKKAWHDIPKTQSNANTPSLQKIEDTTVWAATNGRASVKTIDPRLARHFTLINMFEPSDTTLTRVYSWAVESHLGSQSFSSEVVAASTGLVAATVWMLREIMSELRPTPARSLCFFDPRDAANCIQGVLRCRADDDFDRGGLTKLWMHEALRTFGDRLDSRDDTIWFLSTLRSLVLRNFKLDTNSIFSDFSDMSHNECDDPGTERPHGAGGTHLQDFIFGDFYNLLERGVYLEARELGQVRQSLERAQETEAKRLVLAPIVVAHVSRVARVLALSKIGHVFMNGASGTGKRAVLRLAVRLAGCKLREPRPYSAFDLTSWRNELKDILRCAGIDGETPVCLMITETHVLALDTILADICDVVSIGAGPDVFATDERLQIVEQTRSRMRNQRGIKNADMIAREDLFAAFLERVRTRFHFALVFSLRHDPRRREGLYSVIRRFPSLMSHFTCVDYYGPWQTDSLTAIAEGFLPGAFFSSNYVADANASVSSRSTTGNNGLQHAIIALCSEIHTSALNMCDRRVPASTSTFIELLAYFRTDLKRARAKYANLGLQYGNALKVAECAKEAIGTIRDGTVAARAAFDATQTEASSSDGEFSQKKSLAEVESKHSELEADAEALLHEEAAAQVLAEEFERDISHAKPAFDDAYFALEALPREELSDLRSLSNPPVVAKPVIEAVCILLGEKASKAADPSDPTRRVLDYWSVAQQRVLSCEPAQLVSRLRAIDHDQIPAKAIAKLNDTYVGPGAPHEAAFLDSEIFYGFTGASICRALCQWVCAASKYEMILRIAQPKRDAATKAKADLQQSLDILNQKRAVLHDVEASLADIAARRDAAWARCSALQEVILTNSHRLERAECLLDALTSSGELTQWQKCSDEADARMSCLFGDAILSSGALTYLTAVDSTSQIQCFAHWADACRRYNIAISQEWSGDSKQPSIVLAGFFNDCGFHKWSDVLCPIPWYPRNIISTDIESAMKCALFAKHGRRWPLMLDPHDVVLRWLLGTEAKITTLNGFRDHSRISIIIETAAPLGETVVLERLREEDLNDTAILEVIPRQESHNMLGRSTAEQVLPMHIGPLLSSKIVQAQNDFRFYMLTQECRCPATNTTWDGREQVAVINFAHSSSSLRLKMLRIIVLHAQPCSYEEGVNLVQQDQAISQRVGQLEAETLSTLIQGNADAFSILDDGLAIERSQLLMHEVKTLRMQQSELAAVRQQLYDSHSTYFSVAQAMQSYFRAISDLVHVERSYAFSLGWFVDTILRGSLREMTSDDLCSQTKMMDHISKVLYRRVDVSLLSKDKLLFVLLLTVRPQLARSDISLDAWRFLLTGKMTVSKLRTTYVERTSDPIAPAKHENPAKAWLPEQQWNEMCTLATLPTFAGLIEEFEAQIKMWKRVHDASEPHLQPLPRHWDADLQGVDRLCVLRCLRPDYIANAVRTFVRRELGEAFLEGTDVDISKMVAESSPAIPIVVTTRPHDLAAAASFVVEVSQSSGHTISRVVVRSGHMQVANTSLNKAKSECHWILFENLSVCPGFARHLEDFLDSNRLELPGFRLWCVIDMQQPFPQSMLRASTKITFEPLRGVRAVVQKAYAVALKKKPDFLTTCTRGNEFRRLFFSLCIFHSLICERSVYGAHVISVHFTSARPQIAILQAWLDRTLHI